MTYLVISLVLMEFLGLIGFLLLSLLFLGSPVAMVVLPLAEDGAAMTRRGMTVTTRCPSGPFPLDRKGV